MRGPWRRILRVWSGHRLTLRGRARRILTRRRLRLLILPGRLRLRVLSLRRLLRILRGRRLTWWLRGRYRLAESGERRAERAECDYCRECGS